MSTSRYSRQQMLPQIGAAGQRQLATSKVVMVGVGGLGCQIGSHLAGAGIGWLRVIDHDRVELSNLHRQSLFREADVGHYKARIAERELSALNKEIELDAVVARVNPDNLATLLDGADLVIDAADNFATSYLLSDACLRYGVALLSASVNQSFGYIGVFCGTENRRAPSIRAVFPRLPKQQTSCDLVGVTGPSVGVIGSLQAQEAIKVLLHDPDALFGRLLYVDLWKYQLHCIEFSHAIEPDERQIQLIGSTEIKPDDCVLDVRSADEIVSAPQPFNVQHNIPLAELPVDLPVELPVELIGEQRIVCVCRSGQRALIAAQVMLDAGYQNVAALVPDA